MAMAALLLAGCLGEVELGVVAGVDACHRCNMLIDQVNQACGYIEEGELVVFDAPGCLLGSYDEKRTKGTPVPDQVFFSDFEDGKWHSAQSTAFLLTDHLATVMESRVICFGSFEAAEGMRKHVDEKVTDWLGYRTARGNPNKVLEIVFDATAMVPDLVEVVKGDLVLLKVKGERLEHDLTIAITGYPEAASITVPASGGEVDFRFLAVRPGSGFPVIDTQSGNFLGRVRVSGAHTFDEEET